MRFKWHAANGDSAHPPRNTEAERTLVKRPIPLPEMKNSRTVSTRRNANKNRSHPPDDVLLFVRIPQRDDESRRVDRVAMTPLHILLKQPGKVEFGLEEDLPDDNPRLQASGQRAR